MSATCTVLVVDDEPLIRADLAAMLEDEGCTVFEAKDAAEAIDLLQRYRQITVVFTDIQMPGTMDGVQLAQYVRKRWPPTIIVVSSGKAPPEAGVLASDIPFLSKPYSTDLLNHVISDVRSRLAEM